MEKGRETDTIVAAVAPEAEGLNAQCAITEPLDPCTIVIFGATGDLTARKLIPALFNLYHQHGLPERFVIVGCGRTRLTDREFRSKLETALPASDSSGLDGWQNFARRLFYQTIDYDDRLSYVQLADTLKSQ
ncbi:MAG: glucose-6-phosphate dehydrogenase, partial [Thermodesulfobacteriota bacterium]|nr:glucose-6-phosphate dehydrogenase [Thermodesulfobacteriota bacterium]